MSSTTKKHRIVVLGGGYSGVGTASRLAGHLRRDQVDITVVNARPGFVERVRLHQVAAGQRLRDVPLEQLLRGSGVGVRVARATALDTRHRRIVLDDADEIGYDTLVYALGSQDRPEPVPGVAANAYGVATRRRAGRLRDRLIETEGRGSLTVVGGGMTGLEVATELAETHPLLDVRLVTAAELGDWLVPRARVYLSKVFARLGIDVRTATITEVRPGAVVTSDGEVIDTDTTVWTTGFAVPELASEAGLAVNAEGRIHIDQTMRCETDPHIYAIGDAAVARAPQGNTIRMACGSAMPMGIQAADAIAARLTGRRPHRFVFRFIHHNISLGRRDGLIQFVRSDDRPRDSILKGKPAAWYKELVSRWAVVLARHCGPYLPRRRRRLKDSNRTGEIVDNLSSGKVRKQSAADQ